MARKNKKCSTCGSVYSYCPTCNSADRLAPAWKSEFCSKECSELWDVCTQFNLKLIDKSEAQNKIKPLVIKPVESYTEMLQKDIKNITSKDNHEVVKTKKENKAQ